MAFSRLPESVQTLYAELMDQLRASDSEAMPGGSFVSKQIGGRTYWYLQKSEGATKRQVYLGAESLELLERMRTAGRQRSIAAADEGRRRDLVTMLAAGGMFRESAAVATVLRVLRDAGVFRAGGVLVGTQALSCIGNLLGVRFDSERLRTADIDVAHDSSIPVGVGEGADMLERLKASEPAFFAVPGLDQREASTSFKVRGRDLRVDFLTPERRARPRPGVVFLPHLGVAAQPLKGLNYLIEDVQDAAVVAAAGIRVTVPSPARFALHKLWVASSRPSSETTKMRKDLRQSRQILEVLVEDRPGDVTAAYRALAGRAALRRAVDAQIRSFAGELMLRLRPLIQDAALSRR